MSKSPAFQLYPADFLSDENVMLMNNQELGCYCRLLFHCWIEGSIPNDISKLAKLCNERISTMKKIWEVIKVCFFEKEYEKNRLFNSRLENERDKQIKFKVEKSFAGRAGMEKRWADKKSSETQSKPELELEFKNETDLRSVIALLSFCYNRHITGCYSSVITNYNFIFIFIFIFKEKLITKVISKKKAETKKIKVSVDNFQPTEQHRSLANDLGLDVDLETEIFKDRNKAGGHKYVDCNAAFRNWLRLAKKFKEEKKSRFGVSTPVRPQSPTQQIWYEPADRQGNIYVVN